MATYIVTESQIKKILMELNEYRGTYYSQLDRKAPFFINEGLIKTYPTKTVINIVADIFHLKKRDFHGVDISGTQYIGEIWLEELEDRKKWISVIIPDNEPFLLALEEKIAKYGWVRLGRRDVGDVGDDMIRVDFEKKISNEELKEKFLCSISH